MSYHQDPKKIFKLGFSVRKEDPLSLHLVFVLLSRCMSPMTQSAGNCTGLARLPSFKMKFAIIVSLLACISTCVRYICFHCSCCPRKPGNLSYSHQFVVVTNDGSVQLLGIYVDQLAFSPSHCCHFLCCKLLHYRAQTLCI